MKCWQGRFMFEVRTVSPFDNNWKYRDTRIFLAAAVDGNEFISHFLI